MTKQDLEQMEYLRYYLRHAPEVHPLNGNLSKAERVQLNELIGKLLSAQQDSKVRN